MNIWFNWKIMYKTYCWRLVEGAERTKFSFAALCQAFIQQSLGCIIDFFISLLDLAVALWIFQIAGVLAH